MDDTAMGEQPLENRLDGASSKYVLEKLRNVARYPIDFYKGLNPKTKRRLRNVGIYGALIVGGAFVGGEAAYKLSHDVFNSVSESAPEFIALAEIASQTAQDTYATLAGLLAGATGGGLVARKVTKSL